MKRTVLILLSGLAFACNNEAVQKPEHLIKEDDMVNILYDISLLQAIKSYQPQSLDSSKVEAKNYIYKKYAIDSATFAQNQAYYAAHLEKYEGIQKRLLDKIDKEKKEFAPNKDNKVKKDSVGTDLKTKKDTVRKAASDKK